MKMRKILILVAALSLTAINIKSGFPQEPAMEESPMMQEEKEPETQWVWAEAVTVDAQNKTLLVKYLDYETDQEKEATVTIDDKTTYENIKSLDEIKPNDALSIDYIVSQDGKIIARNISLENPEAVPMQQPESSEDVPPVEEEQSS